MLVLGGAALAGITLMIWRRISKDADTMKSEATLGPRTLAEIERAGRSRLPDYIVRYYSHVCGDGITSKVMFLGATQGCENTA